MNGYWVALFCGPWCSCQDQLIYELCGHVAITNWLSSSDTDLCPCGETQTMFHIVESCPLTKLNGSLSRLHSADENTVLWLTNYGSWHTYEKKKWQNYGKLVTAIINQSIKSIKTHFYSAICRNKSEAHVATRTRLSVQIVRFLKCD